MRESFVIHGADYREIIRALRSMREEVGDLKARLSVLLEGPLSAQDEQVLELAVLEVLVAETCRRMLPVQLIEQRLGIVRVDLARPALHKEVNHVLRRRRKMRRARRERILCSRGCALIQ